MTGRRLRCAGSPWRILVHERFGGKAGPRYGRAYDVRNARDGEVRGAQTARRLAELDPDAGPAHELTSYTVLEGTEFDELVVGRWIHLEQMDAGSWWMNVGGVTVNIRADRDGRPRLVDVYGPGDYAEAYPGCRYSITWSGGEAS